MLLRALLAAKKSYPLVLGKTWDAREGRFRDILVDFLAAARSSGEQGDPRASILSCTDDDGVIRRFPGEACQPEAGTRPLAAAVAMRLGQNRPWNGLVDYSAGPDFSYVPLGDVLAWARAGERAKLDAAFAGRIVLLGPVLPLEDRHRLPVALFAPEPGERMLPGTLFHAQLLRNMMNDGLIATLPGWLALLLPLPGVLLVYGRRPLRKLLLWMVSGGLLFGASWLAFGQHLFLPVAGTWLAGLLALLARAALDYTAALHERRFLKQSFGGFVSPPVLKAILAGRIHARAGGHHVHAAVLFADIRGFTSLSAQHPPEKIVELLNDYLTEMTEAIHAHHGTVDKFIGDGIMAVFGSPEALPCAERDALEAAQEMLLRLAGFNRRHADLPLQIGIGIHSGTLIAGNVGSPTRFEFTAIGDVVNTASRLEGLTKEHGYPVVVSAAVAAAVGYHEDLVALGTHAVRGRGDLELYGWRPRLLQLEELS